MDKRLLIGAGALVVVLGGFFVFNSYVYEEKQGENQENVPIVGENLEGEADPSRMTLGMTEWRWVKALYNDGREVVPKKFGAFSLTFGTDGRFSAKTDCNSMGGSYKTSGNLITFSEIMSTLIYCEGSQESEFSTLLQNTENYHFTSRGELILGLKYDSGSVIFR